MIANLADAFEGAECVKVRQIGGIEMVQVWYGGVTVRVFSAQVGARAVIDEETVWTISDENGRPLEQEVIESKMLGEFERARREFEEEEW